MDDRNEEFRRRLERISQSRAERTPPAPERPASRAASGGGGGAAFEIVLRVFSYLALPLVFFVVLPWIVLSNLPSLTAMLNLPNWSMGLDDKAAKKESRDFSVRFGRLGAEYGDGHVANAEAKTLALADLAGATPPAGPDTPVKDVTLFDANTECTLRRPEEGEKVANVYVRGSGIEAPVRAIQNAELLKFLEDRVEEALKTGDKLDLREINEGRFSLVDVYVTDTSAPLYLVLQSFSANTVWNLHAAPGVDIAHVAMLSGGSSGLAGDIGDATVEGIRAEDLGPYPETSARGERSNPADYECMAWPYQQPNETWTAWKGSQEGNTLDGNLLFGQANGFDIYEIWYRKTLGASPNDNAVITSLARAALVGPVPEAPLAFAPQEGLSLRLMRHDQVFTGTSEALAKQFTDHYRGFLDAAAGGDYAAMTRPEIDLVSDPNQPKPAEVAVEGESGGLLADLVLAGSPWEQEFNAMIDMTKVNAERRVGFTQDLALESLLKDGEAMPAEDQQLLYAMLRAPQALESHCAETLVEIASKCRVVKSQTWAREDGIYTVDVTLGYVPNYAIGALEKKSGWAFESAFLPDLAATEPYDSPEERKAFLRRLAQVCDQLRAEHRNCVVSTVGFYLDRQAKFSGGSTAWAAGWVSVYIPDNPFEKGLLKDQAEEIWAGLQ